MKLKVTITGSNVHNVGYRPFLISLADEFGIEKFEVYNSIADNKQAVIARLEAEDDDQFKSFLDALKSQKPRKAKVSDIRYEPFDGRVRSIVRTSLMNMNAQLAKGIDAIDGINDKMDLMLGKQDKTIEILSGTDDKIDSMLGKQDETLGEIRGLRRDLAGPDRQRRAKSGVR